MTSKTDKDFLASGKDNPIYVLSPIQELVERQDDDDDDSKKSNVLRLNPNRDKEKPTISEAVGGVGSVIKDTLIKTGSLPVDIAKGAVEVAPAVAKDMFSWDVPKAIGRAGLGIIESTSQLARGGFETWVQSGVTSGMGLGGPPPTVFMNKEDAEEYYAKQDWLRSKQGKKFFHEEIRKKNPFYKMEKGIDKIQKDSWLLGDEGTTTGDIIEVAAQWGTPALALKKGMYGVWVGGQNAIQKYGPGAISSFVALDPDEGTITTMLNEYSFADTLGTEFGGRLDTVIGILAKSENESEFLKRLKNVGAWTGVDFGVDKIIGKVFVRKTLIEKAHRELLKTGKISDETLEELNKNVDQLKELEKRTTGKEPAIKLNSKGKKRAEEARKRIENATKSRTTLAEEAERAFENKKKASNTKEIESSQSNIQIYNQMVEEFEEKLTINAASINHKTADKEGFVRISKMVNGRRVVDGDKVKEVGRRTRELGFDDEELAQQALDDIGQPIYMKDGQEESALGAIFDRTVNVDNMEALARVAIELRKRMPDVWDSKRTVLENIYTLASRGKITKRAKVDAADPASVSSKMDEVTQLRFEDDHPLWEALDAAGMSFQDFVVSAIGSASDAGRILNRLSQVTKRYAPKSKKQQQELDKMMRGQHNLFKFYRRLENIRRGLLVSQIATAARNLESGALRSPVEAIVNIMETATYDLAHGKFGLWGEKGNRVFKADTWKDSLRGLKYMTVDQKSAKDWSDYILKHPELQDFHNMMYESINEIQMHTGRGTGTALDNVMSKAEDVVKVANFANRWQDMMLRRATFISEAQRLFRLEWDMDLLEALDQGKLSDILRDSQSLNKGRGKSAMEIFGDATNRALDLTYAGSPETQLGQAFANTITRWGLTPILPFPRWMAKSMELMAENSVGAFVPIARRAYNSAMGSGKYVTKTVNGKKVKRFVPDGPRLSDLRQKGFGLTRREHRMFGRNLMGVSAIMASSYMFSEDGPMRGQQGDDYKMIPIPKALGGGVYDTSPLFPVRQFLFLGKLAREWTERSRDIGWASGGKEAFLNEFDFREWSQTFAGSNVRVGVGGYLLDEAITLFDNQDLTKGEIPARITGEILGNWLSTWAVPLNQIIDAERAIGTMDTGYTEQRTDPPIISNMAQAEGGFGKAAGFAKDVWRQAQQPLKKYQDITGFGLWDADDDKPKKEDIFQKDRQRLSTDLKLLLGASIYSEDSDHGKYLKSLGFSKWELSSKSKIPTIKNFENKLIRKYLPDIVSMAKEKEKFFARRYEQNRKALSSGPNPISKKQYIRDEINKLIVKDLDKIRNSNVGMAGFNSQLQARQVNSMLQYRRLSSSQKKSAYNRFREEVGRSPMAFTEEMLRRRFRGWETFDQERKNRFLNKIQLEDLEKLYIFGSKSK